MNTVPLRRLIRKHGNVGYLVAGVCLLGHHVLVHKRRYAAGSATATLVVLAASALWLHFQPSTVSSQPAFTPLVSAQSYTVTDLGVVSGYESSFGEGVNNKGQASGDVIDKDFEKIHGFAWSNGKMVDVGTLGGDISINFGINDEGQIAGTSVTKDDSVRGYVWKNGKLQSVGSLGGDFSFAQGINNKGEVVGISMTARGLGHAFVWKDGRMTDIGVKCPGQVNVAVAINDNSDVAGLYTNDGETIKSFVFSGGKARDLPSLGGDFTVPTGISKTRVVGFGTLKPGDEEVVHGFIAAPNGIQDLGTLGGQSSIADGINENGEVVGGAETASEAFHAFVWRGGKMTDLNTLIPSGSGWELLIANGINDRGQIVGTGIVGGKTIHAFLLTPRG